ncbi:MAG: DUF3467 domain-containing protein [Candidatus Acidiferrales bacterium]
MSKKAKASIPQRLQPDTPEDIARKTARSVDFEDHYFNHARVATGFLDVRIFLGQQSVTPTGEFTVTEQMCVIMTPEFAKILLQLFTGQMAYFESLFGKIRNAPQPTQELKDAVARAQRDMGQATGQFREL